MFAMRLLSILMILMSSEIGAQTPAPTTKPGSVPVYRVTVVARTIRSINYRHRSGATKIDFRGTPLLPEARGEAKVESKQGYIEIEVEFDELQPATRFGPEYLTYVMWAITPEGRPANLGEVLLNGGESKLNVTTELQAFGLMVTAEPYFAVTQPSNVVIMENIVRADTTGRIEEVDAKFELLERGQYVVNVLPSELRPMTFDDGTPLELHEARNAVRIARWIGADRHAAETFAKSESLLNQSEDSQARKLGRKATIATARQAVQTAEDARLITLKKLQQEEEARLRAEAEAEARLRQQAEADQLRAEGAKREADRARREAEREAERAAREKADAEKARAEAEAARQAALADQQRAQAEAERARQAAAEADRLREQAEQERRELRSQLQQQLNLIFETRETARGLIVTLSDVLFDTGKHVLKPGAREKLSKVAGILLAHPGLTLEVEGHTDSVGSEDYNQRLSERRASSVRDYLVEQGVPSESIVARGLGETLPIASNDHAAGRQQNRRVELVVSGEPLVRANGIPTRRQ